jgi:hypothetical protein
VEIYLLMLVKDRGMRAMRDLFHFSQNQIDHSL